MSSHGTLDLDQCIDFSKNMQPFTFYPQDCNGGSHAKGENKAFESLSVHLLLLSFLLAAKGKVPFKH